jgi:hypothetical protein
MAFVMELRREVWKEEKHTTGRQTVVEDSEG